MCSELPDLIEAIWDAIEATNPGQRVNRGAPPATAEQLDQAEAELGFPLPADLRALYEFSLSNIAELELLAPERLAEATRRFTRLREDVNQENIDYPDPTYWPGEVPQGAVLLPFGGLAHQDVVYEIGGPLDGRIALLDFRGPFCWGRLARSLTALFEWILDAAQRGAFMIQDHPGQPFGLVHTSWTWDKNICEDPVAFLAPMRPAIAAAGGTPAWFGYYDPPPGYTTPGQ
ncbi:MAG: SMI1/KNR4 family protein [Acidimicrobiales bacterium]